MKVIETDGTCKLSIYKKGRTEEEDFLFTKKRTVDNTICLVSCTTGGGKTSLVSNIMNEYMLHGYTAIIVTEKYRNEFENAFCEFPPVEDYHLKLLEKQRRDPKTIDELKGLVKRYHPFTFKIPTNKIIPKMKWFTFGITGVHEKAWGILIGSKLDNETARLCASECLRMKPNENYLDFLSKIDNRLKVDRKKLNFSTSSEDLFISGKVSGTLRTLDRIRDSFLLLRDHYMLQPRFHKLNLNYENVVNDNKHIHLFSTKWIDNDRFKYFCIFQTLINLQQAISSGRCKCPVLLILEEIKILLPKKSGSSTSYELLLAELLRKLLSSLRNQGKGVTVIATTQNYFETNEDFRSSCNMRFIGKSSPEDIKKFSESNVSSNDITTIKELKVGEFVIWEYFEDYSGVKFYMQMPTWGIPEERLDYFDLFNFYYKDEMENYKDIVGGMRLQMKEEDKVRRDEVNSKIEEAKGLLQKKKMKNDDDIFKRTRKGVVKDKITFEEEEGGDDDDDTPEEEEGGDDDDDTPEEEGGDDKPEETSPDDIVFDNDTPVDTPLDDIPDTPLDDTPETPDTPLDDTPETPDTPLDDMEYPEPDTPEDIEDIDIPDNMEDVVFDSDVNDVGIGNANDNTDNDSMTMNVIKGNMDEVVKKVDKKVLVKKASDKSMYMQAYTLAKDNKDMSWREIGKKLGKSVAWTKINALMYAKEIGDKEFIDEKDTTGIYK